VEENFMFKYVGDISNLAHHIIEAYIGSGNAAIDGTLGNGFDCDFLSEKFKKVYAFDIQNIAIENYSRKSKENVILINDSHDNIKKYINEEIDVAMYNLGFLPGGDKNITTEAEGTIKSIKQALELLKSGGFITIAVYIGHDSGKKESEELLAFVSQLSKKHFGVMTHNFINRSKDAPYLIVIEKK
jgi:3-deoxy-D-arabino-heptulosonate 7-phosphate (DAHP) synthase